jgi:chorismate dehydratase
VAKIRVGIVDFLNAWPLSWGFRQGFHQELFAPVFHPPAKVADLLAEGRLEVGLIPVVELQRIPDLRVIPDLCVAATHEVRSVLLVLGRPLAEVERVALDDNSRTSATLVKVLLADRFGLTPAYHPARADLETMLAGADAALVIGDPALRVDRRRHTVVDLAAEWRALTGLPFVFAVWAVAPGVALADLPRYFKASLHHGLSSLPELVVTASAELGLPAAEVRTYLTENLSFFLREEELAAVEEYFRRAHAHGLIEAPRRLELWAA